MSGTSPGTGGTGPWHCAAGSAPVSVVTSQELRRPREGGSFIRPALPGRQANTLPDGPEVPGATLMLARVSSVIGRVVLSWLG